MQEKHSKPKVSTPKFMYCLIYLFLLLVNTHSDLPVPVGVDQHWQPISFD